MEENENGMSKFMNSMLNSSELGMKSDGSETAAQAQDDKEDSVWQCFSYMFKIKGLWLFAILSFLVIFANEMLNLYAKADEMNLAAVLVCGAAVIIGYPLIYGYLFKFMKTLAEQQKEYSMPKFKIWESIVYWFKFAVVIIFAMCIPFLCGLFIGIMGSAPIIMVVLIAVLLAWFCLLFFCCPAFTWIFANTKWLTTFYRYKKVFALFKANKSRYLDALGASIVMLVSLIILTVIITNPYMHIGGSANDTTLMVNKLMPLFLSSIINTYAMFVYAWICAKCVSMKEIEGLEVKQTQ